VKREAGQTMAVLAAELGVAFDLSASVANGRGLGDRARRT
jgi:hypothetical protein